MNRRLSSLFLFTIVAASALAGCLGGKKDGDSGVPIAFFTITPKDDGITFLFDATNSSDPDGGDLVVQWNFGDGGEQVGTLFDFGLIEYQYAITGTTVWVTLVVIDEDGDSNYDMHEVSIGTGVNNPPTIQLKNATRWVQPNGGVVLDASRSSDPDGDVFTYEWYLGNYSATPAPETNFTTDYLFKGGVYNQTFDTPGVYIYHCHPHPWMKGVLVVTADDPNATSGFAQVDIENFAFHPKTATITPGTSVTFRNLDPVEHTATLERFAPGKRVSTTPILSAKLPEGDHQAVLVLNDLKGGMASQTWGLKASSDAPASPKVTAHDQTGVNNVPSAQQRPAAFVPADGYVADWAGNLTVTVSWDDGGTGQVVWKLTIVDLTKTKTIADCTREGLSCTAMTNLQQGDKVFFKLDVTGPVVNGRADVDASMIQWSFPPFGDSVAGNPCKPGQHFHAGMCH